MMLIGKKYGRYEIRSKIGAGGMGEVYSAYDEELNRKVALKILTSDYTSDEFKKSRFRREARAASGLNHPNIITIYEIGEHEGEIFIATELIDGKTLREVIRKSPLLIIEALRIATQITDALVMAHSAHIVHRDIKPENIMIRQDGYAKVLDFGLAKPTIENDDSDDGLIKTTPGMVIGSVRYMSPEQARGVKIDERTDIWSLGVVLFEMLTGKTPFDGATTSETLANVIYQEAPPISSLLTNIPAELEQIISKALQKDISKRYQTIREFSQDLHKVQTNLEHEISLESQKHLSSNDWVISENPTIIHQTSGGNLPTQISSIPPTNTQPVLPAASSMTPKYALFGLIAVLAAVSLAYGAFRWFGKTDNIQTKKFEKTQISRLTSDGKVRLSAISPDGKYVAYVSGDVGNRSLVVRQVATDSVVTAVPSNVQDFRTVTFSPDGNHILYTQSSKDFSVNTLYQVPTLGGASKKLIEDVDSTPTFSPDGKQMAFIRHVSKGGMDQLLMANADGSDIKTVLTNKDTSFDFFNLPAWSPKGEKIVVTAGNVIGTVGKGAYLLEISIADKSFRKLSEKQIWQTSDMIWFRDGSALLLAGAEKEDMPNQVLRISYPSGEFQPITNDTNNYFNLGISEDSSVIIAVKSDPVYSVWNYEVVSKTATQIIPESPNFEGASGITQTPDSKIIYTRRDGKNTHIWVADNDGKNPRQLTSDSTDDFNPVVSPDGKYVVFTSTRSGTARLWRMDIDGKNPIQITEENPAFGDYNAVITADSKSIVFNNSYVGDKNPSALLKISIDGGKAETIYSKEGFSAYMPQLSPDNKTIAYTAYNIETFEKKLYLAEFDGNQVGKELKTLEYTLINKFIWSPDGKSLSYWSSDGVPNIWKVSPDGTNRQQITNFTSGRINNFAWSKDGKNLLLVRPIVNNELILIKDVNTQKT